METTFSKMLVQLRKNAGFPTAYRFYHSSGGAPVLKVSYRKYLLIEQGKILPVFDKLGVFIWAVKLVVRSAEANALIAAWLKTMAGDENFKDLIEPLLAALPAAPGLSPMQNAMKKILANQKYSYTVEQVEAIFAAPGNYLCNLALSNDTGAWSKKELASKLKLKEAAVEKALKTLTAVKLLKEVKKGVYKSLITGMLRDFPHMNLLSQELRKKIHAFDDSLSVSGEQVYLTRLIVRADETDFNNYIPVLAVSLDTVETYSVTEKTAKSALFMVEGKVLKLRDF